MRLAERYKMLAETLEADIRQGVFSEKLPGTLQLSTKYEVAPKTVMKAVAVLQESGVVTTRKRSGTYITLYRSGRPKHMTLGLIGFPLNIVNSAWRFEMLRGMAEHAGFDLISLQYTRAKLLEKPDLLTGMPVDGFLFDNSELTTEVVIQLRQAGIPFVSLNRLDSIPGISWVDFDVEWIVRSAVEYLVKAGHQSIAIAGFRSGLEGYSRIVRNSYVAAMNEIGAGEPEWIMMDRSIADIQQQLGGDSAFNPNLFQDTNDEYGRSIVKQILTMKKRPSAVFVNNHRLAASVLDSFEQRGVSVPDDISIITVCGDVHFPHGAGVLTQIVLDMEERCRVGLETLIGFLEGDAKRPIQKRITGRVLEGISVAKC